MRSRSTQSRGMWNASESSLSPTFIFRRSSRFSKPRCGSILMSFRLKDSSFTSSWNFWWKYSMIFSLTASSLVRERKPILRSALMRRSVSRRITPSRNSGMPSRIGCESSATAPKSSSTKSPSRVDQDVPGVRIGVVDAVDEDHLAVDADEAARELLLVDAHRVEAREVGELLPFDERRREHAARRELAHRHREVDARVLLEVRRDLLDVVGLAVEVELLPQQVLDLVVVARRAPARARTTARWS